MTFARVATAFAALITICTAQSLQTAAPPPLAGNPAAGICMSEQPAGQLSNSGTGTVSATSDVATVRSRFCHHPLGARVTDERHRKSVKDFTQARTVLDAHTSVIRIGVTCRYLLP